MGVGEAEAGIPKVLARISAIFNVNVRKPTGFQAEHFNFREKIKLVFQKNTKTKRYILLVGLFLCASPKPLLMDGWRRRRRRSKRRRRRRISAPYFPLRGLWGECSISAGLLAWSLSQHIHCQLLSALSSQFILITSISLP